ncbi:hypothetical protein NCLIV_045900 [Neospora caninum Liverpool]|uniref:Glutaredoxin, putative n=1 Tax=Neospora caninum (strain Liverpool) TaxID=572307 RepID=F0VLN0_NEOCL|nr:hypothetical protein NCLIV_045900 [Neospora caninum Liverpool]CBZ54158.1 hypothetical protein NCLIV_045900 [Neospora caninum Liverpool]CEL68858.1 TPA: glutaredoxin, putative [Neospora caninum Liverpool]|eukprot:XP_003884189.1 hypothetical protein NCLIV_045900 [Neospora caninum Liverpool]
MRLNGNLRWVVFFLPFSHLLLVCGRSLCTVVAASIAHSDGGAGNPPLLPPADASGASARRLPPPLGSREEPGRTRWPRPPPDAPSRAVELFEAVRQPDSDEESRSDLENGYGAENLVAFGRRPGSLPRGGSVSLRGGFLNPPAWTWPDCFLRQLPRRQRGEPATGRGRSKRCHCRGDAVAPGIYCSIMCAQMNAHMKARSTLPQKTGETADAAKDDSAIEDRDTADDQDVVLLEWIKQKITQHKVVVFVKSFCPFCQTALEILRDVGVKDLGVVTIEKTACTSQIQDVLERMTGARTVPRIFIGGKFFGGCSDLEEAEADGELQEILAAAAAV